MGSFDCYCALCSGPLGRGIVVGSDRPKHLRERRRKIGLMRRRLQGEPVHEDSFTEMHDDGTTNVWVEGAWQRVKPSEHKIRDWEAGTPLDKKNFDPSTKQYEDHIMEDDGDEEWEDEDADQGRHKQKKPKRRRKTPEIGRFGDAGFEVGVDSDWEGFSDASVVSQDDALVEIREAESDDENIDDFEESTSYDPEIVTSETVKWTNRCRVLGIYEESDDDGDEDEEEDGDSSTSSNVHGNRKAFISARGAYTDYYDFHMHARGGGSGSTWDPRRNPFPVYHSYNIEESGHPTFPFHEACYRTLARHLGYVSERQIDKGVLYAVMQTAHGEYAGNLDFNYGDISGAEQTWLCAAGCEFEVADPEVQSDLDAELQDMLPARLFEGPSASALNLSSKVKQDPFTTLPYDIIYIITGYLPMNDTFALMQTSWKIFESTQHPSFWHQMVRSHIAPWFYELKLKDMTFPDTFDWRGMFQWLNSITKLENGVGVSTALAGVINRRRIWNVCSQIAPLYFEKLNPVPYDEPADEEAQAILSRAHGYHTPATLYPQPDSKDTTVVSVQFIRSWDELQYRSCELNTYWTEDGESLRGISVSFGVQERLFGSKGPYKGVVLRINGGDWIRALRIRMQPIQPVYRYFDKSAHLAKNDPNTLTSSCIDGITILLESGTKKDIQNHSNRMVREFQPLPGLYIVGLTGEIAPNGDIVRFGLLQAPQPGVDFTQKLEYDIASTVLWKGDAVGHFCTLGRFGKITPFLDSHTNHLFPGSPRAPIKRSDVPDIVADMHPYDAVVWKDGPEALKQLTGISTFEHNGKILGIFSSNKTMYGEHHRHVGEFRWHVNAQVPEAFEKMNETTWEGVDKWKDPKPPIEESYKHFAIDGAGGERITEIHASADRRAFRIATNGGRLGAFGPGSSDDTTKWDVFQPEEGHEIVGMTATFGELQDWIASAALWSHTSLSDFGVITLKRRDE